MARTGDAGLRSRRQRRAGASLGRAPWFWALALLGPAAAAGASSRRQWPVPYR